MNTKISIIGAGSAVFSLNLIKDICLTPNLQDSIINFMDIDKKKLDTAYILCKKYSEEAGIKLRIEKTTDRRKSLQGADFVINTALAASHKRLREGWDIARKYGYRWGGSLHIMHDEAFWINFYQLQLMESILCDILEICPHAWYLLVANPVLAGITFLKRKYKKANIVGLCHGYSGIFHMANVLKLEKEFISYEIPGVNHFVWLNHFTYKGKSVFPLLDKWVKEKAENYWKKCSESDGLGPKPVDLYKKFGVFPIGDTCTPGGGSWPFWYHTHAEEKKWKENPGKWWDAYFKYLDSHIKNMKHISNNKNIKVTDKFPLKKSHEPIISIIESIACDIPGVHIVNILNSGNFVEGIPEDFEVEVPAKVSGNGIQGLITKRLPDSIINYIYRDRIVPVEMELHAYDKKDKRSLLGLIMMDPWTRSEEKAKNLLEEILNLPYHAEMRKYYK